MHLKAKEGLLVLLLRAMFSSLMELRGNVTSKQMALLVISLAEPGYTSLHSPGRQGKSCHELWADASFSPSQSTNQGWV